MLASTSQHRPLSAWGRGASQMNEDGIGREKGAQAEETGPRRPSAGKHWAHHSVFFKLQVTTHHWIVKSVESVVTYILLNMK